LPDLFFYGTLRHVPLLQLVAQTDALELIEATLPDHAVFLVQGANYPAIRPQTGAQAAGVLVRGLDAQAIARLDYYEGGHDYRLVAAQVATAQGPAQAQFYLPQVAFADGGPFDLNDWAARWGAINVAAAAEVMRHYGTRSAGDVMARYPSILSHAASTLRAAQIGPATLRHRTAPGDVVVQDTHQPYAAFFAVEEFRLSHRRFDGAMSPVLDRAVFISGDAATVLPYDPVRDAVLLIEQFRPGPMARGDAQCWLLEAIAGRIDPGETPQDAVRREAVEEADLTLGTLHPVARYYPTPAAKSEYIYSYVALCDLPDSAAGVAGLPGEGEDIRAHVVSFDAAMDLMASGEIVNAPLILSLQWLAMRREELRADA